MVLAAKSGQSTPYPLANGTLRAGDLVTDESGLVGLLHRADWTRLSLSAEVSDGSAVLVAPGKRYCYRTPDYMTGCDGGRPWELAEEEDDDSGSVHWISGPEAPLPRLLCPDWLLEGSRLALRGRTRFCGREALDVVMTRRPSLAGGPPGRRVSFEVVVDAETGILLRVADPDPAGEPEVIEFVRADFAPVIDTSRFQPPPGSRVAESLSESLGPALRVGATAAGLAAGALGAWIRYSPFRRTPPAAGHRADVESMIPRDEPPPDRDAESHVSDELLNLLHAGGPTAFAATLEQWTDIGAMAASVPASARRAGLGGLGLLMDTVSGQPTARHSLSTLRFAGPGRYQIDRNSQQRRRPTTIACDGEHCWQVYPDKIITGPAKSPPRDLGHLADPSWLLRCMLSGGVAVTARNRSAYRLTVTRRQGGQGSPMLFPAAVAVVDADLGILARLTWYIGDRPVRRYELRDITTAVGEFRPHIPDDRPVTETPD
jgi:hypothetical protein